jgi:putative photosynthetic complex assembly protein 2
MTVAIASAVLYTLFLWWFSTGAILWLDRLPRTTYRWSLTAASAIAAAAVFGLIVSARTPTQGGAFLAFSCALALWGWHELSFLTGFITGPRSDACPPGASGWTRFKLAASTLIHHEIALAVTAAAIALLTWGQPNQIGTLTFLILLVSRLSAKLNLFFGVPRFTSEFFPEHLRYLTSYLRRGPANRLFALSILGGCAALAAELWRMLDPNAAAFQVSGYALLLALTALALIEHAFMVLPLPDAALWRWAIPASEKTPTPLPLDL